MRCLYHMPLSPASRKVRLVLGEKRLAYELRVENAWESGDSFLAINPSGETPALVDEEGVVVCDDVAICEYLDERYPDPPLLGSTPAERAEARRLVAWFDRLFFGEVTQNLAGEKIFKRLAGTGAPDSARVRLGITSIRRHLDYIDYLVDRRNWLAGDSLSMADIAAAAQLSTIDYAGDVPWEPHPGAHDWYARIKSRPSFRPLLQDRLAGLPPAKHYADLDF
ncbi:MAG: glutathione S-transferase [Rhodospirillaceae bacterium]|nr:glutathione S-transferase [Rhodospirillaceae bacterium]